MSVRDIETAAKELPANELEGMPGRLFDFFHERWDKPIKADAESGRRDALVQEAREEIGQGRTQPL
ncbi:hypothetical protein WBJ53_14010 [Spirosoma sp. SC4-14]|uniref:hypothetical protein n=1 Tax=Spirosoma sp. SC4-14 TaxID=3128900 RepID=UPI0030CDA268